MKTQQIILAKAQHNGWFSIPYYYPKTKTETQITIFSSRFLLFSLQFLCNQTNPTKETQKHLHRTKLSLTFDEDCNVFPRLAKPKRVSRNQHSLEDGTEAINIGKVPAIQAALSNPTSHKFIFEETQRKTKSNKF